MDCKKIGEYIQAKRKEVGLTQAQLGEMLGVTSKAVSKWECGVALPDVSLFLDLSKILKIEVSELLNGEDNKIIPEDKKKNIVIAVLSLVLITFLISFTIFGGYVKKHYSKTSVYELESSKEDFSIKGNLICIEDKNYLSISEVAYVGSNRNDMDNLVIIGYEIYNREGVVYKSGRIEESDNSELNFKNQLASISVFSEVELSNDFYFLLRLNGVNRGLETLQFDIVLKAIE